MNENYSSPIGRELSSRRLIALACVVLLMPGDSRHLLYAQAQPPAQAQQQPAADDTAKIPPDQLDSLVAPIALYPDPLLSQVLVASTYPLELIQLQQWLEKNKGLKDKALTDAVSKEPWDPSIQAMAVLPDAVKRLADDIQWTTDLGNAFLAQQSDVMDAVQRMRHKAEDTGALKTTEQQKVETQQVDNKSVIVVQPANPQVVYVPTYSPTVVYGPPVYPYPPIYYPPVSTGAVIAASAISFGVGLAVGAAWGGGWGWGCGWGHNNINVNVNNNFVRNSSYSRNTNIRGNNNTWQHNPQHRGGAPYSNRAVANKYGGTTRGASLSSRQASARQQIGRQGGNFGGTNAANRGGSNFGGGNARSGGNFGGNRSPGQGNFGSNRAGGDRVGNRSIPHNAGKNRGAFGSSGYSGRGAASNGSRGFHSMGGGGGMRGGGRRR
jgi:Protein of unknown function (DUF3300)